MTPDAQGYVMYYIVYYASTSGRPSMYLSDSTYEHWLVYGGGLNRYVWLARLNNLVASDKDVSGYLASSVVIPVR